MKPDKSSLTACPEWEALLRHQEAMADCRLRDLFAADPMRFQHFSVQVDECLLDYSKNFIDQETLRLLFKLAIAKGVPQRMAAMFRGEMINTTEQRAVLHTALRRRDQQPVLVEGQDIMPRIRATQAKMQSFVEQVHQGNYLGATGQAVRDIVTIGVGGSHLGVRLATQALSAYATAGLRCHFISTIDGAQLSEVLGRLNPETTLFVLASKSFTTMETLMNANLVKRWLMEKLGSSRAVERQLVAITAKVARAEQFGIAADNIFEFWDWVGGRYSLWSAMGLPLALMIGMDNFNALLDGAYHMDFHFTHAAYAENMPIILALIGIWNINFLGMSHQAIIPYDHRLRSLRPYLQQLDMESNGKSVTGSGSAIAYQTGPIVWGEQGCHGQHAFHQLLYQGQHQMPIDFILPLAGHPDYAKHQEVVVASCLSQSQALMMGNEGQQQGLLRAGAKDVLAHKTVRGNQPSNTLCLDRLTPFNLGMLIALYEHKVFVQGVIWDINSFDQWGVELGKQALTQLLSTVSGDVASDALDSSTQGLMQRYQALLRKRPLH